MSYNRTCFNCGQPGHNATACPTAGNPSCYNCGQQGHISSQCGMEAQPKTCYKCNETGHISRECPTNPAPAAGGPGGECYKCGQHGHIARACPTAGPSSRGGFGGPRAGGRSCYNCGGVGHLSRECTSPAGAAAGALYKMNTDRRNGKPYPNSAKPHSNPDDHDNHDAITNAFKLASKAKTGSLTLMKNVRVGDDS
ncbi:hypothetical protein [Sporisorium scitamineum]|uniref:CCHC-type domain-containing protein n=1 Tax=Sporisorium scitamineum TaxID=49012 RepID=A0A0F7S5P2_9BASI|nr:hypothetical protein [Sporisorium scitamineum]